MPQSPHRRNERTIMPPRPAAADRPDSRQVLFRTLFRVLVLIAFASLGRHGFGKTFATLLAMSAIFCGIVAVMRREAPFGPVLTHFDEGAIYAALSHVSAALS
jgi:hypothetical protein